MDFNKIQCSTIHSQYPPFYHKLFISKWGSSKKYEDGSTFEN